MRQLSNATVFTTGQVSKLCQVAPRTVSKWFDTGRIKGYRIPGSQDRRIPRENLVQFLKEHGMPLGALAEAGPAKVLLIGVGDELRSVFEKTLSGEQYQLLNVDTGFEAGAKSLNFGPNCLVIDAKMGTQEAVAVVRFLKAQSGKNKLTTIALYDDAQQVDQLLEFDERFRKPFDLVLLAERVRTLSQMAN